MRILVITQKADREDDVFGFFHCWLEKLATKVDFLNVICLWQGQYALPSNARVWSLGKETKRSRIRYLFRFYKYIWKLRRDYDGVFVHMNPIYVVLGCIFWKIWKRKIFLWYNHHFGNLITKLGIKMADNVFYTSPFSFAARFKKSKIMPAGIDTEIFKRDEKIEKMLNSILYVGRISPIKSIDILIEAAKLLDGEGVDFALNIVGEPGEKEIEYFKKLKEISKNLENKGKIKFLGKIPNYKTPEIYNLNEISVNLSPPGLFDKAILEAMACQTLVLVSSEAFQGILPDDLIFREKNPEDLKNKIQILFNMSEEDRQTLGKKLREYIVENHNLETLIKKIISEFYV